MGLDLLVSRAGKKKETINLSCRNDGSSMVEVGLRIRLRAIYEIPPDLLQNIYVPVYIELHT